ncbi:MAG: PKD domain-containing protein, partial [Candidatus Hydrogenedentes bacterium]|nr:PKD domain-containing protein [Candidatus Hydrogenedentota bacterium]
ATTVVVVDEGISGLSVQADPITILGDSTQMTVSVSAGSRVSYTWDFGDGATGAGDALTHTYAAIGTYTATVTATNSVGQQVSDVQLVIVDVPAQGLSASNDGPNTVNQATQLSATISGGTGVSYAWAFGDGTTGSGASPVHVYSAAGSYLATVTASNTSGEISSTTQVTIWPEPTVAFENAAYSVDEGVGTTLITVTLDVTSSVPVTVSYASADGDAVAPSDYSAISGTLVFTPGVIVQTIALSINDDALDELNEGFTVTLSAPVSTTLGTLTQAAMTIIDDDAAPAVQFSLDDYSAAENAGSTVIRAVLSAQSGLTVGVAYSSSDVTANTPADYIGQSGVLTFAPGTTVQTFTLTLVDDALDELDESVVLSLSGPVNANLGGRSSAMLTIVDDEVPPTAQFDSAAYTVTESAGNATITVTLSAPSAMTATVGYTVANDSAVAPGDFVAASGVLTFSAGQITQTITVALNDDALDEL